MKTRIPNDSLLPDDKLGQSFYEAFRHQLIQTAMECWETAKDFEKRNKILNEENEK